MDDTYEDRILSSLFDEEDEKYVSNHAILYKSISDSLSERNEKTKFHTVYYVGADNDWYLTNLLRVDECMNFSRVINGVDPSLHRGFIDEWPVKISRNRVHTSILNIDNLADNCLLYYSYWKIDEDNRIRVPKINIRLVKFTVYDTIDSKKRLLDTLWKLYCTIGSASRNIIVPKRFLSDGYRKMVLIFELNKRTKNFNILTHSSSAEDSDEECILSVPLYGNLRGNSVLYRSVQSSFCDTVVRLR